ncbi:MAG: ABC transporter substrate-binding protein [Peptostreptococcaceae bacterium]|nr:ABC transporter substrate-binding protein [Peptostreptococcaceae bacterium]
MKRILPFIASLMLIVALAGGCAQKPATEETKEPAKTEEPAEKPAEAPAEEPEKAADPVDLRVLALKGPTAMGMVHFMNEAQAGNLKDNNYQFSIAAKIDEVAPKLLQGEVDIAAVPANMSSVLFNKTQGKISVLGINTLGVLYIVEKGESISSVKDLQGKTLFASGKGATPEYVLNYILSRNGLEVGKDVMIEWKSEHAECLAALGSAEGAIAMLPQPFVTVAQTKMEGLRSALDLTKEWNDVQPASALITGVTVARREFIENNPQAVAAFMEHYKTSVDFVHSSTEEAAQLVGKYDIVPPPIAAKALPHCNIVWMTGAEMKEKLAGYLAVLHEQNPESVGGALPGDEFYYDK